MKKIISFFLSISFMIALAIPSFAKKDGSENWYFLSKSQNDRPRLPVVDEDLAKGIGKDEKVLYLTFDAGYENGNVEKTVDILKEHEVTGAFFILKHFANENPELCKKMAENKNLVCNHTANHPNITTLSAENLKAEIREMEEAYEKATGLSLAPFFRPPEGGYNQNCLQTIKDCGYRTVFWSLAWADWDNNNQKGAEYAMEKLTSRVHNGAVILLHPTSKTNTEILGDFIEKMKAQGYRFGSLEELWEG